MFSVVDRLLIRALPIMREPGLASRVSLVRDYRGKPLTGSGVPYARSVGLTTWTTSLARTAEVLTRQLAIGVGENAVEMQVGVVSDSFFCGVESFQFYNGEAGWKIINFADTHSDRCD